MIEIPHGYMDAHGFAYNGAILLLNNLTYSHHQSTQLNLQMPENVPEYVELAVQTHTQIGFTAVIFANASALAEGKPPINFRPANHSEYFNLTVTAPIETSEMVSTCEAWLLDNIFNTSPNPAGVE